jgi:hypothetical protein
MYRSITGTRTRNPNERTYALRAFEHLLVPLAGVHTCTVSRYVLRGDLVHLSSVNWPVRTSCSFMFFPFQGDFHNSFAKVGIAFSGHFNSGCWVSTLVACQAGRPPRSGGAPRSDGGAVLRGGGNRSGRRTYVGRCGAVRVAPRAAVPSPPIRDWEPSVRAAGPSDGG